MPFYQESVSKGVNIPQSIPLEANPSRLVCCASQTKKKSGSEAKTLGAITWETDKIVHPCKLSVTYVITLELEP